jgi:hypothetical protein
MKITKKELIKLSEIRKKLIANFNNRELTSFQTVKDLDTIIETLLINSSTDTYEAIKNNI